jgi:hypothetical protein
MSSKHPARTVLASLVATSLCIAATAAAVAEQEARSAPVSVSAGRVAIAGTSNIHAYTASTTAVRVTRVQLASGVAGEGFWDAILKPGAIEAFEIAIPAASLSSPKDGLDKNMHKALKVKEHADILFSLTKLEPRAGAAGAFRMVGVLTVAGVPRTVTIDVTAERKDAGLAVKGELPLLITDFGIEPPKAMLGMLKTDPKVVVTFETILSAPLT